MTPVPRRDSTDQVGLVSLLMAVGLLDAILDPTPPPTAEPYCVDGNYSVVRALPYAFEASQSSGTCDDDFNYYGKVSDALEDDYCVRSAYTIAGVWNYSRYECTLDDWTNYNYRDDDGHS